MPTLPPARRARVLWVLALLVVFAGWAGLARGGITVSPLLLVFGYLVIVPLAILAT